MDWKIFFATFGTIFLAEMGDKTQLAAVVASSNSKSTWSVLLAVVLALGLAGAVGVVAGRLISGWIDPRYLSWAGGVAFIVMGLWMLVR